MVQLKKCLNCKEEKTLDLFSMDNSRTDRLCPYCKICKRKSDSSYGRRRSGTPEGRKKKKEISDRYYAKNKTKKHFKLARFGNQLQRYWKDLNAKSVIEIYNYILTQQNNCCAICGKHQSKFKKSLFVDHCHTSGVVRGLLCANCNSMIGHSKDSIENLLSAVKYLEKGIT